MPFCRFQIFQYILPKLFQPVCQRYMRTFHYPLPHLIFCGNALSFQADILKPDFRKRKIRCKLIHQLPEVCGSLKLHALFYEIRMRVIRTGRLQIHALRLDLLFF